MDTRSIRTLMEINSLQSLGAVQTFAKQDDSTSSLFNIMLEEVLGSSSTSDSLSSISSTILGMMSTAGSINNNNMNIVFNHENISKFEDTPANEQYGHIIREAAEKYDLPERLISSIIRQESNFNNNVTSHAGAQGLMQLMPGTAKFLGVTDSFDPKQNIFGGAKYMRQMLNQFNGNIELALAAYNAGPGNVKKFDGIPPFKETQQYVKKVLGYFDI